MTYYSQHAKLMLIYSKYLHKVCDISKLGCDEESIDCYTSILQYLHLKTFLLTGRCIKNQNWMSKNNT